jgi:HrpA-like RNA helicase
LHHAARDILLKEIRDNQSVIVIGETGSGKTTQIAQYLYEEFGTSGGGIAVTQPRRLAAKTTASRVAEEMGCELGDLVGYNVRFDNKTSDQTRVKFLTDGMLLRECMVDRDLKAYSYILIDEAHERSINSDLLCALVRQIQDRRKDLKVIIMSATLEADLFEKYFKAKVLYVQGRQYPVEVFYTNVAQRQWIDSLVTTVIQINLEETGSGDILAFLTGKEEIEDVARVLEEKSRLFPPDVAKLIVCPLYAAQSTEQQQEAFEPTPRDCRKVVLATNIAETSITVPNIKFVIDSGLVKLKQRATRENIDNLTSPIETNKATLAPASGLVNKKALPNGSPSTAKTVSPSKQVEFVDIKKKKSSSGGHVDMLAVASVSRAQAWQRAGRAGRTQPGKTYRLYTENYFLNMMPESQIAEIKRVDLTNLLLQLLTIGIEDVLNFPWLESPDKSMLRQAMVTLITQKAVDREMKVTKLGRQMSAFPIEPRYSKVLICSAKFEVTHQVLTIVAMLNTENVFYTPSGTSRASGTILGKAESSNGQFREGDDSGGISLQARAAMDAARRTFASSQGDHIFLLNVYTAYQNQAAEGRKKWAKDHLINWRSMEQAIEIRKQLEGYWRDSGLKLEQETPAAIAKLINSSSTEWQDMCDRICKSFIMGFFEQVAIKRPNGTYETLKESAPVAIHPASIMFNSKPECLIFNELVYTKNFYMRDVLAIQRIWLDECVPNFSANSAVVKQSESAPSTPAKTPTKT